MSPRSTPAEGCCDECLFADEACVHAEVHELVECDLDGGPEGAKRAKNGRAGDGLVCLVPRWCELLLLLLLLQPRLGPLPLLPALPGRWRAELLKSDCHAFTRIWDLPDVLSNPGKRLWPSDALLGTLQPRCTKPMARAAKCA